MSRAVYSTSHGKLCPTCEEPVDACTCAAADMRGGHGDSHRDGIVRVRRESKGRRGKTATVILGLPGDRSAVAKIAKELKRRCGCGGSAKNGVVELQGDRVDIVIAEFQKRGLTVKRAGG